MSKTVTEMLAENIARKREAVAEIIAKDVCLVDTLTVQNRDSLDFHEIHVANLKKALEAAFEAGRLSN